MEKYMLKQSWIKWAFGEGLTSVVGLAISKEIGLYGQTFGSAVLS